MAAQFTLLHHMFVSAMPDADWGATQVAPAATLRADIAGSSKVAVAYKAYTSGGVIVNPSGNCDLQPVLIGATAAVVSMGIAAGTLVGVGVADAAVTAGTRLTYDDLGNATSFTVRVSAQALAGTVSYIDIFWNTIE